MQARSFTPGNSLPPCMQTQRAECSPWGSGSWARASISPRTSIHANRSATVNADSSTQAVHLLDLCVSRTSDAPFSSYARRQVRCHPPRPSFTHAHILVNPAVGPLTNDPCTVGLLTAGIICLWTASKAVEVSVSPSYTPLKTDDPPSSPFPFPDGITGAQDTYTDAHIIFHKPSTIPTAATNTSHSLAPPTPTPSTWAAINTTFTAASAADAVAFSVPLDTAETLHRLRVFGLDHCSKRPPQCLCGPHATSPPLPPALRTPSAPACSQPCSQDTLQPLLLPSASLYDPDDWYTLRMPCSLIPGRRYTIEWLAVPSDAVLESAAYEPRAATAAAAAAPGVESALSVSLLDVAPSTVAQGSDTGTTRITVTAPAAVTILSSAEQSASRAEIVHDGAPAPLLPPSWPAALRRCYHRMHAAVAALGLILATASATEYAMYRDNQGSTTC